MTVKELLIEVFENKQINEIFHRQEIVSMVQQAAKDKGQSYSNDSILPSDYCYNRSNAGIIYESIPHLFILGDSEKYEYVGSNYKYDGDIVNHNKETQEKRIVGKWIVGKPVFTIKTVDSVWLGAAVLAYNKYFQSSNPTKDDIYFKQSDIARQASYIHGCKVPETLASTQCVSSNTETNYNYLVAGKEITNKLRRLSYKGEFDGQREKPELNQVLPITTYKGEISISDLVRFVEDEYTTLMKGNGSMEKIDIESIVQYLIKYAGENYQKPENAGDKAEYMQKLHDEGIYARERFNTIGKIIAGAFPKYEMGLTSSWVNQGQIVPDYFWIEFKETGHTGSQSSISLFSWKTNGEALFYLAVEARDSNCHQEDFNRHNRLIGRAPDNDDLYYMIENKHGQYFKVDYTYDELVRRYKEGEIKKIRVQYNISKPYTADNTEAIIKQIKDGFILLEPYYKEAIREIKDSHTLIDDPENNEVKRIFDKNIILCGPPGTGKTYNTVLYAVAICDENESLETLKMKPYSEVLSRFNALKKEGRITFTTFHQSYGYEEFIEGIKPIIERNGEADNGDIKYKYEDGIFKRFCKRAEEVHVKAAAFKIGENPKVWNVLLDGAGESKLKTQCYSNNYIKIGWHDDDETITDQTEGLSNVSRRILLNFQDEMELGDIVFVQRSNTTIDGIGVITGNYEYKKEDGKFPRTREVVWIKTGINENILTINQNTKLGRITVYPLNNMSISDVMGIIEKYTVTKDISVIKNTKPYVFIIDEINRGNISKIFGELITLIESTKRSGAEESASAILPYSKDEFSVPDNVYIVGTMNTADRSIALMDTALRRRFGFLEMMPDSKVLVGLGVTEVDGIDIVKMLETMNQRIEYLFDREHTIGHAYFTSLNGKSALQDLASIFINAIIPLLQEYFYDDYSKIQLVLGDNHKEPQYRFILDEKIDMRLVFKGNPDMDLPEKKYTRQTAAFYIADSYKQIY